MTTTIQLSELSLIPTAYKTSHIINDPLLAFVKRLQTLLITEPNSNPAALGMGCGIGLYLQEFADLTTRLTISNIINDQISRYLPNDVVTSNTVDFIDNKVDLTGGKTLVIFFKIAHRYKNKDIAITFTKPSNSAVLTSDIYF